VSIATASAAAAPKIVILTTTTTTSSALTEVLGQRHAGSPLFCRKELLRKRSVILETRRTIHVNTGI
jgi:hypothetical protein